MDIYSQTFFGMLLQAKILKSSPRLAKSQYPQMELSSQIWWLPIRELCSDLQKKKEIRIKVCFRND